jgi:hypothetical protein
MVVENQRFVSGEIFLCSLGNFLSDVSTVQK